ncbi:MAG: hypothetical protein ACFFD2_10855 [Promethearchaeota archaeon]
MGKFFGSVCFFLVASILVYLLNLSHAENYALIYMSYDSFEATHVIAAFELLHHPFEYPWVIPSWFIAGFLSGIITRSWKGSIFISIMTGFILSLTWIFFMWRYVPNYWSLFSSSCSGIELLGKTLGIGLFLGLLTAAPSICGAYLNTPQKIKVKKTPIKEIQTICPNCRTIFQSKPKFCYKCNTLLNTLEKTELNN